MKGTANHETNKQDSVIAMEKINEEDNHGYDYSTSMLHNDYRMISRSRFVALTACMSSMSTLRSYVEISKLSNTCTRSQNKMEGKGFVSAEFTQKFKT